MLLSAPFALHQWREVLPSSSAAIGSVAAAAALSAYYSYRRVHYGAEKFPDDGLDRGDYAALWDVDAKEEEGYFLEVEGSLPPEIVGTLFVNGPGSVRIGGQLIHPFDGHGFIRRFSVAGGRVHFSSRYVQTEAYRVESEAGKVMYRGFGTLKPGGVLRNAFDFRPKNVANTNVVLWNGSLYALWEGGRPHRIDPATLETHGPDDLSGAIGEREAFSAHCRVDTRRDRLVNFGAMPGPERKLVIYEMDRTMHAISKQVHKMPISSFVHDFTITENYYVFFMGPVGVSLPALAAALAGARPINQALRVDKTKKALIYAVPREAGAGRRPLEVPVPTAFGFHLCNAYEDGPSIVLDACVASDFDFGFDFVHRRGMMASALRRYTVDTEKGTASSVDVDRRNPDFPCINPAFDGRSYRYLWYPASERDGEPFPFVRICRVDWAAGRVDSEWRAPPHTFVGEPNFVPRPGRTGEAEGYLVVLLFAARPEPRTSLAFFDAGRLEAGPLAVCPLRDPSPYQFHGDWTPWHRGAPAAR
eukprot:tig00021179_g19254.t1